MGFEEIIGFLIIIFAFIVPLLRKLLGDKKKVEREEEVVEVEPPPPPLQVRERPMTERLVKRDYDFHTKMEDREYDTHIEDRELEELEDPEFKERIVSQAFIIEKKRKKGQAHFIDQVVKSRDPGQAMVILSEIFGEPKGLQ